MALTLLAAMDLGPLEGDADDRAVVEEALALIDALAAAESSSSASSSGSVGSLRLGTSEGPRKKRRRNAAVDVARRRRKKQERVALRNEARGLEERLELMKARASIRIDLSPRNSTLQPEPTQSQVSEWRDRAVAQAQKAAAAIDLNQQLRSALNQQRPLIDVIQSATTANPQPAQMNVNHWDSTADRFNRSPEDSSIMKTLKNSIKQLYGRIDDELAPISFTPGIFSSNLAVKVDPVSGPYSEHTTAALVPHELNVVVKMIEEGMLQVSPPCIDLSFHIKTSTTDVYKGIEKEYRIELHTSDRSVPLRGLGVFRLHRGGDRVAVVWSKQVMHDTGLRFHERAWLVATRSQADPSTETVVRTCYQLNVEKSSSIDKSSKDDVLSDFIKSKLVTRTRDKLEMIQFKLLEKISPVA